MKTKSYRSRYIPAPVITDTRQLAVLHPGQWVKLDWCDHLSRLVKYTPQHVTMFHFPTAASGFVSYFRDSKAVAAFVAFNRHARNLSA